jgi:hypothetical protein
MSPIDFGVTRSKVKVTGFLNVKMISADYLENYALQSLHISHSDWSLRVDDTYKFWGDKVKGQGYRGLKYQNDFC